MEEKKYRELSAEELEKISGGEKFESRIVFGCRGCFEFYKVKPEKCPKCGGTVFDPCIPIG